MINRRLGGDAPAVSQRNPLMIMDGGPSRLEEGPELGHGGHVIGVDLDRVQAQ